ncbi:sensor histidine kinase [Dyella subtropica]|uniref:sensor histidine kinase n=1 Tax=Dyella subtropica TaxID=2992127 RepID=UPI0022568DCF|nr:histidine kinase [Dyella subtropica]
MSAKPANELAAADTPAAMLRLPPVEAARSCPPFWVSIAVALPISLCMVIMGLPDIGHGRANTFRAVYSVAYLVWCFPLAAMQRSLWRRPLSWWVAAPLLLAVSYALSLINNAIAMAMAFHWQLIPAFSLPRLFSGLDGCWLALIGFCAMHAVVNYYTAYRMERERALQAVAMARDAELRALRYQLHPHFLFNTLNAISSLVTAQRSREASKMITQLGDFLRATLERDERHEVVLAEELALTESYLEIEKARLGDRLSVRTLIGPDVLDAMVPFLLLQPLVENAIRHGIACRSDRGRLEIRIERHEQWLRISLGNDGPSPTTADEAEPRTSFAIGLRNVRERLATLYLDSHRFETISHDDGSFLVRIVLPFRMDAVRLTHAVEASR